MYEWSGRQRGLEVQFKSCDLEFDAKIKVGIWLVYD